MGDKRKNLILLTDNYPLSLGEFFLEIEIKYLARHFEDIFIICSSKSENTFGRYVPKNCTILHYELDFSFVEKLISIKGLFNKIIWDELDNLKFRIKPTDIYHILKVALIELRKAQKLSGFLHQVVKENNLSPKELIFYSYWHDYKALSLSLMKQENSHYFCVARGHGWDIFSERHRSSYLPFKIFIINTLNKTFSISSAGKDALKELNVVIEQDKIEVSRLGTNNEFKPNLKKSTKGYIVCSCSNLIGLKRVDLLIKVISCIKLENFQWIHFGDGPLRMELEELAAKHINFVKFKFFGYIKNSELIRFYNENFIDLFINLSQYEGIPVSIMEAQSAGIPVLATDVGGVSEIVNDENGFLVHPDIKPANLAHKIRESLILESSMEPRRRASYLNWQINYNATKNYDYFLAQLNRLSCAQ